MFSVSTGEDGCLVFSGRLDAAQAAEAELALAKARGVTRVDLQSLEYISSAGLGVLIAAHNRLKGDGGMLRLSNPSDHVRHIFHLARLELLLQIE
jgi:anti-sigma B factor antagonist